MCIRDRCNNVSAKRSVTSHYITSHHIISSNKVPLRNVVDQKSRGCRKLKRENTGVLMCLLCEGCEVHWCCTAAAAAVVPLLYCADAVDIERKCGLKSPLVVFRMARPHNTHARTHRHTVRRYRKRKTLQYGYCHAMAATT